MKKKILLGLTIVAVIVLFKTLNLDTYLSVETLIEKRNDLLTLVEKNYVFSYVMYIIFYLLIVIFSLPGAAVSSLAGGLLFGLVPGVIAANIAATSGATVNFIFARYIFGDSLQEKYKDKLVKFNQEVDENGISYMFMLRLIPVLPFFMINLMAGLTKLKMKTFIWTTALGIIPGSIFYVYAGTTLKTANAVGDIFTFKTLIPLILLGVLAFMPVIYNKMKKQKLEN